MHPADLEAARRLVGLLLEAFPEWDEKLRLDRSGQLPVVAVSPSHFPLHVLSVEVGRAEAIVAYSDGFPPGPAEQILTWRDGPLDEGLRGVRQWIAALVRGEVVLVRQRLTPFVRFLRRHDCNSVLRFVARAEFESWPRRRQRRIQRAWSWDSRSMLVP